MKAKHRTLEELEAAGFKIKEYMREDEAIDWCKMGVAVGELDAIAAKYRNVGWNDWAGALQTAVTKANRVLNERLAMIAPKAIKSLINRRNHAKMVITIDYVKRVTPEEEKKDQITITADDFHRVVEMSIVQTCEGCKRCDYQQCDFYDVYLKLCIPPFSDESGGCPYQYDVFKAAAANEMGKNNVRVR